MLMPRRFIPMMLLLGRYRAAYDYYKPGMDMPQVGLYYKFTTKVDGKMKVQVWANKVLTAIPI